MTMIRRLGAVGAVLAATAAFTCSSVWGESDRKGREEPIANGSKTVPGGAGNTLGEDLASSKFAAGNAVTYRTRDGDLLVALQVKPKLEAAPARPLDCAILIDTSASQVGLPLTNARLLVEEIIKSARPDDRFALWTANTPAATRDLCRGFQPAKSESVRKALAALKQEVPLGDTDLANAVEKVGRSFNIEPNRQRAVVYVGDGMSIHSPITPEHRAKLAGELVQSETAFFSVPMGPQLDPQNLHGFATATGGEVVRVLPGDKAPDCHRRLQAALAAPVLYPTGYKVAGADAADFFPTRLPPLRNDAPTLVVGRVKSAKNLTLTVEGKVAGRSVSVPTTEPMAEPQLDNFFLVGMYEQWKNAKDQPAVMQADRALSYAYEVNQFARAEFLAQADEALANNKLETAAKLFRQAKELDPSDVESEGGMKLVEKLRAGKVTREQLRQEFNRGDRVGAKVEKVRDGATGRTEVKVRRDRIDRLLAQAQERPKVEEKVPAPAPAEPDANLDPREILRRQRLAQQVEEQRVTGTVNDAINEARRLLPTDPEGAREMLKRVLASLRGEEVNIGEDVRGRLSSRLESSLRYVETEGARILRDQRERLRQQAIAVERLNIAQTRQVLQEQTQARMIAFNEMMRTARYEDAYVQALAIAQDQIRRGAPVPVAVTAASNIGLTAHHLNEVQEVRRISEERYLATMLQVEKSHVPFPDEPPIRFPDMATWRELTRLRKDRYETSGIEGEDPALMQRIKYLRDRLSTPINFEFEKGPLRDAIAFLQERYSIPIIIDTEAFKAEGKPDVESTEVKMPKVAGITLSTVLRLLLAQVDGTYIIRHEFIEVTTGTRQAAEKAVRVYPVADLVIPIPNAINQAGVNQTLQNSILGGQFSPFGGAVGQIGLGALGALGLGALGALGLGGLGLGGLGLGGLGAAGLGLGGVGLGGGLAGAAGLGGGLAGGLGGQPQNLGTGGGGFVGFAGFGGQLGQLGNLGGQFGLQGGDQSAILIELIRQVVGNPTEWTRPGVFQRPQAAPGPGVGLAPGGQVEEEPAGDPATANSVGYYPPARALVVKGTSRIHTRLGGGLLGGKPGAPPPEKAMLDNIKKDYNKGPKNPFEKMRDAEQGNKDVLARVKEKAKDSKPVKDLDATKIWQEALAKGVDDPGLIIAVTDFLYQHGKYDHVVEFLKANLRQGIVARPWVYEALAIALKETKGAPEEIERAQLSVIDIQPQDAPSYLRAAQAMRDAGRFDRAVAFCRQAALLQPNSPAPYSECLACAELGKDTGAMEWAAGNLISRDWPDDNVNLQGKAIEKMRSLGTALRGTARRDEAERMAGAVERQRRRDLVITLHWQGEADLDLEVREPIGSVCDFLHRQTPGGGILAGDTLTDLSRETYTAAQAFPGEYEVTVRRVWGRPLGSKANLKIVQHQGTPQETVRQETIVFDRSHVLRLTLDGGRRKSVAQVPPPAMQARKTETVQASNAGSVFNKLRALADPEMAPTNTGMRGGMVSFGVPVESRAPAKGPEKVTGQPVAFQTQVSPLANGMDLTAQATVSADRRYVRLSLAPVFQTAGKADAGPLVTVPLIPGGQTTSGQ